MASHQVVARAHALPALPCLPACLPACLRRRRPSAAAGKTGTAQARQSTAQHNTAPALHGHDPRNIKHKHKQQHQHQYERPHHPRSGPAAHPHPHPHPHPSRRRRLALCRLFKLLPAQPSPSPTLARSLGRLPPANETNLFPAAPRTCNAS